MPVCKPSCRSRDGPITALNGGRPANEESQNTTCLKNGTCEESLSMTFHIRVLTQLMFWGLPFAKQAPWIDLIGPSLALRESRGTSLFESVKASHSGPWHWITALVFKAHSKLLEIAKFSWWDASRASRFREHGAQDAHRAQPQLVSYKSPLFRKTKINKNGQKMATRD